MRDKGEMRMWQVHISLFFFKVIYLFLAVPGPHCCRGISQVAASRGHSLAVVCGLLITAVSLVAPYGPKGAWASVVVAHGLSCQQHVESSHTRDSVHVPCCGRQILPPPPFIFISWRLITLQYCSGFAIH